MVIYFNTNKITNNWSTEQILPQVKLRKHEYLNIKVKI